MSIKKGGRGPFSRGPKPGASRRKKKSSISQVQILLESGTLESIRAAKKRTDDFLKYHWHYYGELARQRNVFQDAIRNALLKNCTSNYKIQHWQRAVKYKYGLHPFSTVGSLRFIGGRFNVGHDINSELPSFPALYLAQDKDTALQEHLGQEPLPKDLGLTPKEMALTNPTSETIVSVSGQLDKVFDLTSARHLKTLVAIIKNFKLSQSLREEAKSLGIERPEVIRNEAQLKDSLLAPNWREYPAAFDIPANTQIFGHLIYQAGIEGILYPSKFTGKLCLTVFPHNFYQTESFLGLDDEGPHPLIPRRVDSSNWRTCDLTWEEIFKPHS